MYATEDDLLTRVPEVNANPGDASIALALGDASALIDTYLAKRWAVPLTEPPRVLVDLCIDMAAYKVNRDGGAVSEDLRLRYEDALKLLKDIAKGVIDLPGMDAVSDDPDQPQSAGAVVVSGPPRLFGRDKGY
ncbi:MAG: hypothetical protein BA863_08990 [Desulfovibrio sp. S3730MH75]|nr:MAG: hypothetical protein BA863_08990 [Desulfovibrio sp. S3730MH75]